jgi:hypothetical protein
MTDGIGLGNCQGTIKCIDLNSIVEGNLLPTERHTDSLEQNNTDHCRRSVPLRRERVKKKEGVGERGEAEERGGLEVCRGRECRMPGPGRDASSYGIGSLFRGG